MIIQGFENPDYHYYGQLLDAPSVTQDWAVTADATDVADTNSSSLEVWRFDDTIEEGVGMVIQIPANVTKIVFELVSRAEVADPTNIDVVPRVYVRELPDDAAVEAWSAGDDFTAISMGVDNEYWQYHSQEILLSTLGLAAGHVAQLELTRSTGSGSDTLDGDWTLLYLNVRFEE